MSAAAPVAARAGEIAPALRAKIGALEILFLDVDGTMTDGGVYFDAPAAFGGGCSGADSEIDARRHRKRGSGACFPPPTDSACAACSAPGWRSGL